MKLNNLNIPVHLKIHKIEAAVLQRLILFVHIVFSNYYTYAQEDASYPWPEGKVAAISLNF
jgi:hypothetical protein